MSKAAAFVLSILLSVTCYAQFGGQDRLHPTDKQQARSARKAVKQQRRANNKYSKQQQKAIKKSMKAQKKALKKARRRSVR
jgi:hypothetical protein